MNLKATKSAAKRKEGKEMDQLLSEPLIPKKENRSSALAPKKKKKKPVELLNVTETDELFRKASAVTFISWVILSLVIHWVSPPENVQYLKAEEKIAAVVAFFLLLTSIAMTTASPAIIMMRRDKRLNGIFVAALTVQVISLITNARLAWTPTAVMVDPVTHTRVFLVRWVEWVPLAGLMTFLSEGADIPRNKKQLRIRIGTSLMQACSCVSGILAPFCPSLTIWALNMSSSVVTYLTIFPRVYYKRKTFLACRKGTTPGESEQYDRISFAYHLLLACSIMWSVLVVFFFTSMMFSLTHPDGDHLQGPSLAMILDTIFDVLAKAVYMKLLVQVHLIVFDPEGRTQRQLNELRRLMSVLWYSSSDVIVISAQHNDRITTMFSPSFSKLVGVEIPEEIAHGFPSAALLLETELHTSLHEAPTFSKAFFVDSSQLPYGGTHDEAVPLVPVDPENAIVDAARALILATWSITKTAGSPLLIQTVQRANGEELNCEVRVSEHEDNGAIAVVRDVTERYLRFEAERAHSETLARQRDAQAINRFTRHEVKNGLLAGIELCDSLKDVWDVLGTHIPPNSNDLANAPADQSDETPAQMGSDVSRFIKELDSQLHQTLDTVLAEAMARDVIHEVYLPRRERVVMKELLLGSSIDMGSSDLFPLEFSPEAIPSLLLDPQLVRYIHRNAVSNACKYGKYRGIIKTIVKYDADSKDLAMCVINEPGTGHEELMALAEDASIAVFAQGKRLHVHLPPEGDSTPPTADVSCGDGAWIMQKCAKTMDGKCTIDFETTETVFTFRCRAEPVGETELLAVRDFDVPPGTWGVAVDDSLIQRKLLARILSHIGVDESRLLVTGKNRNEIEGVEAVICKILREHPDSKVLLLVDENLDFRESDAEQIMISGSLVMQDILAKLSREDESRLCVLMRSANDSAKDIAVYSGRTHGFFPKAPMQRERVSEILAPLWTDRFPGATGDGA